MEGNLYSLLSLKHLHLVAREGLQQICRLGLQDQNLHLGGSLSWGLSTCVKMVALLVGEVDSCRRSQLWPSMLSSLTLAPLKPCGQESGKILNLLGEKKRRVKIWSTEHLLPARTSQNPHSLHILQSSPYLHDLIFSLLI